MKKIRLDPESLEVITFATSQLPHGRGTVLGAATGYTCYYTVAHDAQTHCLEYRESYWNENTCIVNCPLVWDTDPSVCLQPADTMDPSVCPPLVDTAGATCLTCPGQPGC